MNAMNSFSILHEDSAHASAALISGLRTLNLSIAPTYDSLLIFPDIVKSSIFIHESFSFHVIDRWIRIPLVLDGLIQRAFLKMMYYSNPNL